VINIVVGTFLPPGITNLIAGCSTIRVCGNEIDDCGANRYIIVQRNRPRDHCKYRGYVVNILDVYKDTSSGAGKAARIFHSADEECMLSFALVVKATEGFYHPGPGIDAEQFGIALLYHVRHLFLRVRIVRLSKLFDLYFKNVILFRL
jgi:hypothetical protein